MQKSLDWYHDFHCLQSTLKDDEQLQSPINPALMMHTGSLVKSLEHHLASKVEVVVSSECVRQSDEVEQGLLAQPRVSDVFVRQIELVSQNTQDILVKAETVFDARSTVLQDYKQLGNIPIGRHLFADDSQFSCQIQQYAFNLATNCFVRRRLFLFHNPDRVVLKSHEARILITETFLRPSVLF